MLEPGAGHLACVAPSHAAGFVAVHVARNGEDFEHLSPGQTHANAIAVEMKEAMEFGWCTPKSGTEAAEASYA